MQTLRCFSSLEIIIFPSRAFAYAMFLGSFFMQWLLAFVLVAVVVVANVIVVVVVAKVVATLADAVGAFTFPSLCLLTHRQTFSHTHTHAQRDTSEHRHTYTSTKAKTHNKRSLHLVSILPLRVVVQFSICQLHPLCETVELECPS